MIDGSDRRLYLHRSAQVAPYFLTSLIDKLPKACEELSMKTVLIVEDDPVNARVFSKILTKRAGLAVKHTENVDEVMEAAQGHQVDVILMDVSLARSMYRGKPVDGIKITQLLKADPETADLPIILVTAHAMEGDREHFLAQSGADGYITKPVIDHQLFVDQIMAVMPQD